MYGYANMPPPSLPPWWMFPPQGNASPIPSNPAQEITNWIKSLEELKKAFKEGDKKPDDKKPKGNPQVVMMALFMILISPITGPAMYHFFQLSLGLVGK